MYQSPLTIDSCYRVLKVGEALENGAGLLRGAFSSASRDLEKLRVEVQDLTKMNSGSQRENAIRNIVVKNVASFKDAFRDSYQTKDKNISPLRHSFLMLERTLEAYEQKTLIAIYQKLGLSDDAYRLTVLGKLQELLGSQSSFSLKDSTFTISKLDSGIYSVRNGTDDEPCFYYFNPVSNLVKCINFSRKDPGVEKIPCHMLSRIVSGLSKES